MVLSAWMQLVYGPGEVPRAAFLCCFLRPVLCLACCCAPLIPPPPGNGNVISQVLQFGEFLDKLRFSCALRRCGGLTVANGGRGVAWL